MRIADKDLGAPFHPVNERPKAACPVCVTEKGDLTYKKLFGIVGIQPGEHDTAIPTDFFDTPPEAVLNDSSHLTRALKVGFLLLSAILALTSSSSNSSQCCDMEG